MTKRRILVIGNSDGIGLAFSRLLIGRGLEVRGISRREAPIDHERYRHLVLDVTATDYVPSLNEFVTAEGPFPTVVYCAGVGNQDEETWWRGEAQVVEVNFLGAVRTLEVLLPGWRESGGGHFVGLSSLADGLHVKDAASYCSSKAGLSTFLESTALRLQGTGIAVSNVRFGFVDTKMAQSPVKPFMITPEQAADVLWRVLRTRPLRMSHPKRALVLVSLLRWLNKPRLWLR